MGQPFESLIRARQDAMCTQPNCYTIVLLITRLLQGLAQRNAAGNGFLQGFALT
jgi:hypothetical protein